MTKDVLFNDIASAPNRTWTPLNDAEALRDHLWEKGWRCEPTRSAGASAGEGENCRRCGGANVVWAAASPLWNYVMRGNDINGESLHRDLVCMPCFIHLAVEAGLPRHGWRLTLHPEPDGLIYETPSGRAWDADKFLWVESHGDD